MSSGSPVVASGSAEFLVRERGREGVGEHHYSKVKLSAGSIRGEEGRRRWLCGGSGLAAAMASVDSVLGAGTEVTL